LLTGGLLLFTLPTSSFFGGGVHFLPVPTCGYV
jgi:hypothetical protein